MAQSATPATQNPTSRHNRGTASQLRKRVRVTDEEDFRVTDEGLSHSKTDLASLVCLAVLLALPLVLRFGRSAVQILQNGPRHVGLLGCAPCSPSGGPFWPLSSPNPPKRTSPSWSAGLCSLLSLWWSVLAAQQPKSSKTDHQRESKEHNQADPAGELRFGGFGPLSGKNGAPGRERDRDR